MQSFMQTSLADGGTADATSSVVDANNPEAQFEFADRLRSEKLFALAIPEFEKFLNKHPSDQRVPDAVFRLADCHYQLQQFPQAIDYYTELTVKHKNAEFYQQSLQRLAQCKLRSGDTDGAIATLDELLKLEIDEQAALAARYLSGKAFYMKQDYEKSYTSLVKVAAVESPANKFHAPTLMLLGDCASRMNLHQEAAAHFKAFLEKYPDAAERDEILLRAGDACLAVKNYEDAAGHYAQVASDSQFAAPALGTFVRCLFTQKKYDDALKHANEFTAKFAEHPFMPEVCRCLPLREEAV